MSEVPTVTGIVCVTILVKVTALAVPDFKRSQQRQQSQGWWASQRVANVASANGHKDGEHFHNDPRIVILFDLADPKMSTVTGMVHVPHHPHNRAEGRYLNDLM